MSVVGTVGSQIKESNSNTELNTRRKKKEQERRRQEAGHVRVTIHVSYTYWTIPSDIYTRKFQPVTSVSGSARRFQANSSHSPARIDLPSSSASDCAQNHFVKCGICDVVNSLQPASEPGTSERLTEALSTRKIAR
ncbi:hypothetical protein VTN31DRAFT_4305 [Thermomyces dupontii]|uniref:uncharacterized protein n=1 Tax=Talaromyces thermophilus TaxID=28565 RepID=UPI003744A29F